MRKFGDLVGESKAMQEVFDKLERLAKEDRTILLLGETGTGKSELAETVHLNSPRRAHRFQCLNCAEIPRDLAETEIFGCEKGAHSMADRFRPGVVATAGKGTLFLDEIGELSLELQAKLLELLNDHKFRRVGADEYTESEARVIAATNKTLSYLKDSTKFRPDLYHRLAQAQVEIPPLRHRKGDIRLLVEHFLASEDPPRALSDLPADALQRFAEHDWMGNVRQLQNVVTGLRANDNVRDVLGIPNREPEDPVPPNWDERIPDLIREAAKSADPSRDLKQLVRKHLRRDTADPRGAARTILTHWHTRRWHLENTAPQTFAGLHDALCTVGARLKEQVDVAVEITLLGFRMLEAAERLRPKTDILQRCQRAQAQLAGTEPYLARITGEIPREVDQMLHGIESLQEREGSAVLGNATQRVEAMQPGERILAVCGRKWWAEANTGDVDKYWQENYLAASRGVLLQRIFVANQSDEQADADPSGEGFDEPLREVILAHYVVGKLLATRDGTLRSKANRARPDHARPNTHRIQVGYMGIEKRRKLKAKLDEWKFAPNFGFVHLTTIADDEVFVHRVKTANQMTGYELKGRVVASIVEQDYWRLWRLSNTLLGPRNEEMTPPRWLRERLDALGANGLRSRVMDWAPYLCDHLDRWQPWDG